MKKKVRIYKSPNGQGAYLNKTSQFLQKAALGGEPDMSQYGYPGAQPQVDPETAIIQSIVQDITTEVPKEKTIYKLTAVMGLAIDVAQKVYMSVAEQINNDLDKVESDQYEEETGMPAKKEKSDVQRVINNEIEEPEIDYDLYDNTGSENVLGQSEQGPDILDETLDPLSDENYRYGGMYRKSLRRASEGTEVDDTYSYSLPDPRVLEEDQMKMINDRMWHAPTMNQETGQYEQPDYTTPVMDYSQLKKGGAYKKAKRQYITSKMKLQKKAEGGEDEAQQNPDSSDPIGSNLRESKLNVFKNILKTNAQNAALQKQYEGEFDQMYQEGGDFENPMHHLQAYTESAGHIFDEPQNEIIMGKNGLNVPKGFYRRTMRRFGNIPNLNHVDVRRSGLFGPKEYTAYFNPSPLQQLSVPGISADYGYGSNQTTARKSSSTPAEERIRRVYKTAVIKENNNESLKEVDANTPGNTATTVVETPIAAPVAPVVPTAPVLPAVPPAVIPPAVTPVTPPAAVNTYMPPAQFDYTPGLSNVQSNIQNFYPETRQRAGIGLKGSSDVYSFDSASKKWRYAPYDAPFNTSTPRTVWKDLKDQSIIDRLDKNEGTLGMDAFKLKDKPGYYYRKRLDGSIAKYKGNPSKHSSSSKPITYITKKDKGWKYLNEDADKEYIPLNLKEVGGSVDNPFADPNQPLQKFIGGGYDSSIPQMTEGDIQYTNSIDTTDPYFAKNGKFIKAFLPANVIPSKERTINKIYDPLTGETRQEFTPGANQYVTAIDVQKRNLIGQPKAYTVYYGNKKQVGSAPYGSASTVPSAASNMSSAQQALSNAGYGEKSDVSGLGAKAKSAVRSGERKRDRELKKLYEEDPTNVEFTASNENAPFDYESYETAPVTTQANTASQELPEYDPNDPIELQYQLDNPYIPPTDTRPIAAAPNNKGKQTEEFCYGNSCFEVPEEQYPEYELFNSTPEMLRDYGDRNNADWYNKETQEMDLSKIDKNTFKKILKEQIADDDSNWSVSKKFRNDGSYDNLDSYADSWLKYQQDNQKTYGDRSFKGLRRDKAALENFGLAEKYADFLNATGKTAEGKPNSIWDTKGPLQFTANEVQSFVPEVGTTVGAIENYRPSRATNAYNYPQEQLGLEEQVGPEDYLFQEQAAPTFADRFRNLNVADKTSTIFNRLGQMGEDMLAEEPQPIPYNGMPQYIDRPELQLQLPDRTTPEPVDRDEEVSSKRKRNTLNDIRSQTNYKEFDYTPSLNFRDDPGYKKMVKEFGPEKAYTTYDRIVNVEDKVTKVFSQAAALEQKIKNSNASKTEKNASIAKIWKQAYTIQSNLEKAYEKRVRSGYSTKQNGGALNKFIDGSEVPFTGVNPVAYTNNPAIGTIDWTNFGVNFKPQQPLSTDSDRNTVPDYLQRQEGPMAIDVTDKNNWGEAERQGALITGNSFFSGIAGLKNRRNNKKQMEGFFDNFNANNTYASQSSIDSGDYSEAGIYRPNEEGSEWNGRAQYGGYINEDPDYVEGDETYMTEDEIKQYMAQGGQIEFL
jgi:hypothetical protein